jgi:histidine ammonia-lyase
MDEILIGYEGMTLEDLVTIARDGTKVRLSEGSQKRIAATRKLVEQWVKDEKTIYGVTTGFGALSDVAISKKDTRQLQENILMSHAAGVGECLSEEVVRAIMALRIKDMARGHSGIRLETVRFLVDLLNGNVCPVVPAKGSVGASGDLAPLAHLSLPLIGRGEVFYEGRRIGAGEALKKCGLKSIQLDAAEGLALVNGTQVIGCSGRYEPGSADGQPNGIRLPDSSGPAAPRTERGCR